MSGWEAVGCLPSPHQLGLLPPGLALLLPLPLTLPWIRTKLTNIQRGHIYRGLYERKI